MTDNPVVRTVRGRKVEFSGWPYSPVPLNTLSTRPYGVLDCNGEDVRQPPEGRMHKAVRFQTWEQAVAFANEMNKRTTGSTRCRSRRR